MVTCEFQKKRGTVTFGTTKWAVVLSAEHIAKGRCGSLNDCALAKAVKDVPGFKKSLDHVEVTYRYTYLYFKDGDIQKFKTPKNLAIQMWDRIGYGLEPNGKPLKPGTYLFEPFVKKEHTLEEKAAIKKRRKKEWPNEKPRYKHSQPTPRRVLTNEEETGCWCSW